MGERRYIEGRDKKSVVVEMWREKKIKRKGQRRRGKERN